MQNQVFTITDKHRAAARIIFNRVLEDHIPKNIITVTGEVGTGKSTVSYLVAKLLKNKESVLKLWILIIIIKFHQSIEKNGDWIMVLKVLV